MGTTLLAKKADHGNNAFGGVFGDVQADSNSFGAPQPMQQPMMQQSMQQPMMQQGAASQPMYNTQAGDNAAQGAEFVKNDNTDWINKKWRPVMGWVYMATCTADFVVFPVLWSILQTLQGGQVTSQWQPLTLQGAGLYHIAMGAVLGIAAYGRTKEKVAGAAG
jgi:hypothetical protein